MKKYISIFFTMILILLIFGNMTNASNNNRKSIEEYYIGNTKLIVEKTLNFINEPIKIISQIKKESNFVKKSNTYSIASIMSNKKLSSSNSNTQFPVIVTNGKENTLCIWNDDNEPFNSFRVSNNSGETWGPEYYYPDLYEYSKKPRIDYNINNSAYSLFAPDGDASELDFFTFPDFSKSIIDTSNFIQFRVLLSVIGCESINDIDIASCPLIDYPKSDFLALIAITGDFNIENIEFTDSICLSFVRSIDQTNYLMTASYFLIPQNYHLYNLSIDFDPITQHFYFAAEVDIYQYDNSIDESLMVYTKKVTSDSQEWIEGPWYGIFFLGSSDMSLRHPLLCVNEKRWYLAFESNTKGNRMIEYYYGEEDMFDLLLEQSIELEDISYYDNVIGLSSESEMNASILFTKNNNLFVTQTKDGGETWNENVQINDVNGTVVSGYRNGDISHNYVVWSDNRYNKNEIFFDTIYSINKIAVLKIDEINSGIGITTVVRNSGPDDVENLNWSIDIHNGFVFGQRLFVGLIDTIKANEYSIINLPPIFGFGAIEIVIEVSSEFDWVEGDYEVFNAFLIGPFIIVN